MGYLARIRKACNISEIESIIQEFFNECNSQIYIPAILKEGLFTRASGEDFYLKLTLFHQKSNLKKTWPKDFLSEGLKDPDDLHENESVYDHFMENIITFRQVKGASLYQLNPLLATDGINEYEYDNNSHVNAFYHDGSSHKGAPVLKKVDESIMILRKILLPFLNELDTYVYPKYRILADYEFRTHSYEHFKSLEKEYRTEKGIHDILIDDIGLRLRGSMFIEVKKTEIADKKRSVKVVSFPELKERDHNPSNYNDDTNAGFVIFKKEVLSVLKKRYYFFDLMMFDKTKTDESYLIDVLMDKVVFWEGEYNKLPTEVRDLIDSFNFIPPEPRKFNELISPAMKTWQLDANWDYHKALEPEHLLANKIRGKKFNFAMEKDLSFLIPENLNEFCNFIKKVEDITGIRLERFNSSIKDVQLLLQIRDKEKVDSTEINLLFKKYCFQIYQVIKDE